MELALFYLPAVVMVTTAYTLHPRQLQFDPFLQGGSKILSRTARGVEEAYEDDDYVLVCCNKKNKITPLTSEEIRIMEECVDEVENELVGERDKEIPLKQYLLSYSTCGNQCLFQKHGWIDDNGNIPEESARVIASTQLGIEDPGILETVAWTCPIISRQYTVEHQGEYLCNRTAMMFYTCAFDILNLYCPKENHILNDSCNRRMERVKSIYQK